MTAVGDLGSSHVPTFAVAAMEAIDAGPEGERRIVEALAATSEHVVRVLLVGALGDCTGPLGVASLRECRRDPRRDVRAEALTALARRLRGEALPEFLTALGDRDVTVRLVAATLLVVTEAEWPWDEVYAHLPRTFGGRSTHVGSGRRQLAEVLLGMLLRTLHGAPDRAARLTIYLREHQGILTEDLKQWLDTNWPRALLEHADAGQPLHHEAPLPLMPGVPEHVNHPGSALIAGLFGEYER